MFLLNYFVIRVYMYGKDFLIKIFFGKYCKNWFNDYNLEVIVVLSLFVWMYFFFVYCGKLK